MFSSSNFYFDGVTAKHLSPFHPEPMLLDDENVKMPLETTYYSSGDAGSRVISSKQLELNLSKDSTSGRLSLRRRPSPASRSCGHHDWGLNSGHQAKRARVENIIKCMTSSPGRLCREVMANQHERSDGTREHLQDFRTTGKEFESQRQHLRQLRTRFSHVDAETNTTESDKEEKYQASEREDCKDSSSEFESRKYQGWKKVKLMNYFQSKPERIRLIADVLKFELSRAVSLSIDSFFKSVPLLQNDDGSVETDMPLLSSAESEDEEVPDVQTEALSLVVQKPPVGPAESRLRAPHRPKPPPVSLGHVSTLKGEQLLEKCPSSVRPRVLRCQQDGYSDAPRPKLEMFDAQWDSVKVRPKVNSRSVRSPQTRPVSVDPVLLESLCFPRVKIESDHLVKNHLYVLNEGLTTNHLKKAKLMFFYTRYPSSLVLKMCFHDVQFTRCITSQLIKWFSNFREFYYIQMEKFARHALAEGAADVGSLTVGRESELFRALNMHYNKTNDFQVPDRFLEVAEITLREFYVAISMGKDRDPSWKKAIYKVICKLDSDVPDEFKLHHSG